jgi:hypothetical protein
MTLGGETLLGIPESQGAKKIGFGGAKLALPTCEIAELKANVFAIIERLSVATVKLEEEKDGKKRPRTGCQRWFHRFSA